MHGNDSCIVYQILKIHPSCLVKARKLISLEDIMKKIKGTYIRAPLITATSVTATQERSVILELPLQTNLQHTFADNEFRVKLA